MLKAHIIEKIQIETNQQRNLGFVNAAIWLKAKDNSTSNVSLFVNILTAEKAIKLKVDQGTITGANDVLFNGQINIEGYKGIQAITLELQSTCNDLNMGSTHLEIDYLRKRKKAA